MRQLREHTAKVHAATEALPLMQTVLGPRPTTAGYRRYLRTLHDVYTAVEPALYAAIPPALVAELGIGPKLPALQQDLQDLMALQPRVPATTSAAAGSAATGPPSAEGVRARVDDLLAAAGAQRTATALGGLYVLEGATLGGQVIARRLRSNWLGAPPESDPGDGRPLAQAQQASRATAPAPLPTAFLEFRSRHDPGDWRRFGTALEAWAAQAPNSEHAVLNGALRIFEAMHAAFAEAGS
jgi:heme oxygenase